MADTTGTRFTQIKSADRHGTQIYGQASDNTGASGHIASFNADGSVTDSGLTVAGVAGGSGTWVYETPSGTLNGTNTTFTLSFTPISNSLTVYLNGVEQDQTRWASLSTATITFTVAPISIDFIKVKYQH